LIKTKEQLAEEKAICLSIRIKPLDVDSLSKDALKRKADELWNKLVILETERYDLEERQRRQDYDVRLQNYTHGTISSFLESFIVTHEI
jgi:hypothetical protein